MKKKQKQGKTKEKEKENKNKNFVVIAKGAITLNKSFDNKTLKKIKSLKKLQQQLYWNVSYHEQDFSDWTQFLEQIIQCTHSRIQFDKNKHSSILRIIQNINFRQLRTLLLHGNCIDNIQPLSFLQCSNLQELNISDNKISSIRSLSKCVLPNLNWLALDQNPIKQVQQINRMNINEEFFKLLCLQYLGKNNLIFQDISFISKFKSKKIIRFLISSTARINMPKVKEILTKKQVQHFQYIL